MILCCCRDTFQINAHNVRTAVVAVVASEAEAVSAEADPEVVVVDLTEVDSTKVASTETAQTRAASTNSTKIAHLNRQTK